MVRLRDARLFAGLAATLSLSLLATHAAMGATAATDADPPGRVARLSYVQGQVSLLPGSTQAPNNATDNPPDDSADNADANSWTEATLNRPLTGGDKLSLANAARAELQLGSADLQLDG